MSTFSFFFFNISIYMSFFFCSVLLNLNRFVYYQKHCSDMNHFRLFRKFILKFKLNYFVQKIFRKQIFEHSILFHSFFVQLFWIWNVSYITENTVQICIILEYFKNYSLIFEWIIPFRFFSEKNFRTLNFICRI